MSKSKVHPPLIRALAHTGLHRWAYCDADGNVCMDHLTEHGIDAYIDERTDAGNGMRRAVAIVRERCGDHGRAIVKRHAEAFRATLVEVVKSGAKFGGIDANADSFCRLLSECDDAALAWWCDTKFGPAMAAVLAVEEQGS